MRTVAAVVALVACVQAGMWALSRDQVTAPGFDGQLASVSYAPFDGNATTDGGGKARQVTDDTSTQRDQDAVAWEARRGSKKNAPSVAIGPGNVALVWDLQ